MITLFCLLLNSFRIVYKAICAYDRSNDLTQFKWLYDPIVSGDFHIPALLKSCTCPNIGSAWASLVIQHYGRGTIQINLEVRNPDYGGSMAASYITVASGQKAASKRYIYLHIGRNSLSDFGRKKKRSRARDQIFFLSIQLGRAWFYTSGYTKHPRFIFL